jgi:hypothetical protein
VALRLPWSGGEGCNFTKIAILVYFSTSTLVLVKIAALCLGVEGRAAILEKLQF